jgi:hypothetical protein
VDHDAETITITFDYDLPAMKVRSTGETIPIGVDLIPDIRSCSTSSSRTQLPGVSALPAVRADPSNGPPSRYTGQGYVARNPAIDSEGSFG